MKRVTMKEISLVCGCSINCVSRALMDSNDISREMKEKINKVANEMGYIKNANASTLRSGNSKSIGIVCDNILNPFYSIMLNYIKKELDKNGYSFIVIYSSNIYCSKDDVIKALESNVDGILSFLSPDMECFDLIQKSKVCYVLLGRYFEGLDSFILDDLEGGYLATKHLIECGHKNILYIGEMEELSCSKNRSLGYKKAINEYNLKEHIHFIEYHQKYDEFINNIETENKNFEAIFCFNDLIAYNFKDLLKSRGYSNIEFIGFDNLNGEINYCRKIKSIGYNFESFAIEAIKQLLLNIKNKKNNTSIKYVEKVYLVK